MRSALISFAPAARAISSIRPSTCAGTPESMCAGGSPRRCGHFARTSSWLPPNAARGRDDGLGGERERPGLRPVGGLSAPHGAGRQDGPVDLGHGPAIRDELVDPVAEAQLYQATRGRRADAVLER